MLNLVETICSKTKTINEGEIKIYNNNWKIHNRLTADFIKESQFANKGGIKILRIKQIVKESKINIKF